ncbi:MAG: hypothetical protein KDK39_00800 [Leptospiraceae bacterium]|nr:hypothetical protein [Leptospiraceae bacterium]
MNNSDVIEISTSERVFQLDRDTFVVYTGMHGDDLRPFIRVGAGQSIVHGYLGQFENVLLLDAQPANIGRELEWLQATVSEVQEPIRYVGSRDRVNQIYNLTGMPELEESQRPLQIEAFSPNLRSTGRSKEKSTIQFFENGNVRILVGRSQVYDREQVNRARGSLDQEFDQMHRAQSKRELKCTAEHDKSFCYLGPRHSPDALKPAIYWNFQGHGVLVNPPAEYHHALFEAGIDILAVDAVVSNKTLSPGMSAVLRRKDSEKAAVALYSANEEKQAQVKKIYDRARLRFINDSASLPGLKDVLFFVSKKGNTGGFGFRLDGESDEGAQVVFPIGGARSGSAFDMIRAPHDLQIQAFETRDEFKAGKTDAHLVLALPGIIGSEPFGARKMESGLYPLLTGRAYRMAGSLEARSLAEYFINAFTDGELSQLVRDLVFMCLGLDFNAANLNQYLMDMYQMDRPTDFGLYNNLHELIRYLALLPAYKAQATEENHKLHARLLKRYAMGSYRFHDCLQLESRSVYVQILLFRGQASFHLICNGPLEGIQLELPPDIAELEANPKGYRKQLNFYQKQLARIGDVPGMEQSLDFLERLYEKKMEIVADRRRFFQFMASLGIEATTPESPREDGFLARWWQKLTLFFSELKQSITG